MVAMALSGAGQGGAQGGGAGGEGGPRCRGAVFTQSPQQDKAARRDEEKTKKDDKPAKLSKAELKAQAQQGSGAAHTALGTPAQRRRRRRPQLWRRRRHV